MEATKVISQSTFDSVVQENVVDFEMEKEEALEDAIEQFTKQVSTCLVRCQLIVSQFHNHSDRAQTHLCG